MDRRTSYKAILRRKLAAGRGALLAVALLTLVNLIFLACKADYHFLLSGAFPYYVNWLCVKLNAAGVWSVLSAILALCLDGFYWACWMLSRRRRIFLTAALAGYGLDTLLLIIFAFTLIGNPSSCVLEILTHIAVLGLLAVADQAAGAMQRMRRRPRMAEPV